MLLIILALQNVQAENWPPTPPLAPAARLVATVSELLNAVNDIAVSGVVLMPGVYEFSSAMCSTSGSNALCISRSMTIEAAVPGTAVLDARATSSAERRVMYVSSGTVELTGLGMTGGRQGSQFGGAVLVNGAHVTMTNCEIFDNEAYMGGGIYVSTGATAVISASSIHGNTATSGGGGLITTDDTSVAIISWSTFRNNDADYGGGIYAFAGSLVLESNVFLDNTAVGNSGDEGCALLVTSYVSPLASSLFNNTFTFTLDAERCPIMIDIENALAFRCALGTYNSPTPFTLGPTNFTGCQFDCPSGTYGNAPNLTSAACSGDCPPGHYCPTATVHPIPCPNGTYLEEPPVLGTSRASCVPCVHSDRKLERAAAQYPAT